LSFNSEAPVIEIEVNFRDQVSLDRCAREGWGPAEAFGAWMLDDRSVLVLPPPPRDDADLVLQAMVGPMLIPGAVPMQRLRILVNDHIVTAVELTGLQFINCPVPREAFAGKPRLEIVFEHPDAARQTDFGAGEDMRRRAGSVWNLTLLGASPLPAERAPVFDKPMFFTRPRGNLANRMIQQMVALAVQSRAPGCRLGGVDLPEWGIAGEKDEGVWADWAEIDEQAIDVGAVADLLNSGSIGRIVHRGYGQRLANFLPREAYREAFRADLPEIGGFDASYLVINVRAGDIVDGATRDYVLMPVNFYRDLIAETGLTPVFMGQTEPNAYTGALRDAFPEAMWLDSLGPLGDFEILRRSANIVVAVSTFSWLAAWLSGAERIFLPVNGLFNPLQSPSVDLLPTDDPRYRFFLFPVNHARADFAAAHAEIDRQWREVSGAELAELRRATPFPATELPAPQTRIEWQGARPSTTAAEIAPGPAYPEDLAVPIMAAEGVATRGHVLDVLHHLRRLPLIEFADLLWSLPRGDLPGLSGVLPRMASDETQGAYTGRHGADLRNHTVDVCRIAATWFRNITGRELRHVRVMDYGCGWGRLLRVMTYFTDPELCVGVDASPVALAHCRRDRVPGTLVPCDYIPTDLAVGERRFDLITSYSIFTHTPPHVARAVLAVLRRKIRNNGVLMITLRPVEYWALSGVQEAAELVQAHRTGGCAYRSNGILSADGVELYGDTSMTLDYLASIAPDWEIEGFDRGMDPLQTLVFLTPR
jgi:hypothetical protein